MRKGPDVKSGYFFPQRSKWQIECISLAVRLFFDHKFSLIQSTNNLLICNQLMLTDNNVSLASVSQNKLIYNSISSSEEFYRKWELMKYVNIKISSAVNYLLLITKGCILLMKIIWLWGRILLFGRALTERRIRTNADIILNLLMNKVSFAGILCINCQFG